MRTAILPAAPADVETAAQRRSSAQERCDAVLTYKLFLYINKLLKQHRARGARG